MSEISSLSDADLLAEVGRRASVQPAFREQALAKLAQDEVRPGVTHTLAVNDAPASHPVNVAQKPPLSPEQMTELLGALENRFNYTPKHYATTAFKKHREGITFDEVKAYLTQDPKLARTVYAMHKRGGEPDVWGRAGKSFLFFEAAKETCPASRNCVYDRQSAEWLKQNRPDEHFSGSVEEQCAEMNAGVVSEAQWRQMEAIGKFTLDSWEWADSSDIISTGDARNAARDGVILNVYRLDARLHLPRGGWRAVAKGSET